MAPVSSPLTPLSHHDIDWGRITHSQWERFRELTSDLEALHDWHSNITPLLDTFSPLPRNTVEVVDDIYSQLTTTLEHTLLRVIQPPPPAIA